MVNREEDVRRSPRPMDVEQCRPIDEALKIFREAMSKSKGKCNNRMAWSIAITKGSTVDDVLKYGLQDTYFGDDQVFRQDRERKFNAWKRKSVQEEKRKVYVRDTYLKKFLESKGLWDETVDDKYGQLNTAWRYSSFQRATEFAGLLEFAKMGDAHQRLIENLKGLVEWWLAHMTHKVIDGVDCTKERKDMLDQELAWLEQAPDAVYEVLKAKDVRDTQNFTQAVFNTGLVSMNHDTPDGAELCELVKTFRVSMNYMGIGIADTQVEPHTRQNLYIRQNIKALMRKTIASVKVFERLVKQGYDPSLARDEIVDQLTQYVATSKCKIHWQFFALNDAPKDYPELAKKVSPKATKKAAAKVEGVDDEGYMEIPGLGRMKVC